MKPSAQLLKDEALRVAEALSGGMLHIRDERGVASLKFPLGQLEAEGPTVRSPAVTAFVEFSFRPATWAALDDRGTEWMTGAADEVIGVQALEVGALVQLQYWQYTAK
jgi:hypothetical protein